MKSYKRIDRKQWQNLWHTKIKIEREREEKLFGKNEQNNIKKLNMKWHKIAQECQHEMVFYGWKMASTYIQVLCYYYIFNKLFKFFFRSDTLFEHNKINSFFFLYRFLFCCWHLLDFCNVNISCFVCVRLCIQSISMNFKVQTHEMVTHYLSFEWYFLVCVMLSVIYTDFYIQTSLIHCHWIYAFCIQIKSMTNGWKWRKRENIFTRIYPHVHILSTVDIRSKIE